METIERLRRDIGVWRLAHRGRRGPLPVALRRRAGVLAGWLGEDPVAEALDLDPDTVLRWNDRYAELEAGPTVGGDSEPATFIEVGRDLAAALVPMAPNAQSESDTEVSLEVTKPCGTRVHIHGAFDRATMQVLLHGALGAQP